MIVLHGFVSSKSLSYERWQALIRVIVVRLSLVVTLNSLKVAWTCSQAAQMPCSDEASKSPGALTSSTAAWKRVLSVSSCSAKV